MKRTAGYSDASAKKCVYDGNKLLKQQNISEAINKYDQAIKERPYYAIPYYNKRIALSMQNDITSDPIEREEIDNNLLINKFTDVHLADQIHPNFVINIIASVPEHTFSDDSSDEELNEEFNALYEKSVNNDSFPFTTTRPNKPKTAKLKVERKIIEPELSHAAQDTADSVVVGPLLSKILENGFEVHEQDKLSTIAVSVGLNRMYSLSTRKNNSLILELKSKVNTREIKCEKFGYYWECAWYTKDDKEANIENVRKFYKQLKRKDLDLAKKFIAQEENERAGRDVPYQDIREYAKNHPKTKELIKEFRDNNSTALIYLHLVDADVYDFNGVHSAYLRIIQSCYKPPTVMSTGYEFPQDTENQAYHLLGHMERMLRVITTFYIPLGTYYPEPNMCILIPQNCETVEESFIDRKRGQGKTLESPILLTNIQNNRHNVYAIFSDDNPIITKIPLRAHLNKTTRTPIDFSDEFNNGLVGLADHDIKKYDKVSQSHTNNLTWSNSLFINNSIKYNNNYETDGECINDKNNKPLKRVDQQCKKLLGNIRNNKDVETSQHKLANRIGEDHANNIVKAIKDINQFNKDFNNEYARTPEEQKLLDIIDKCGISYDNLSRRSLLMMSAHNVMYLIEDIEDNNKLRDVLEKLHVIFSEYEEEYSNLTKNDCVDLNAIIDWDFKKIKFLGSSEVTDLVEKINDDNFNQIAELYDKNRELCESIINDINEDNISVFEDKDFNDVIACYQSKKEELISCGYGSDEAEDELDDINIVDQMKLKNIEDVCPDEVFKAIPPGCEPNSDDESQSSDEYESVYQSSTLGSYDDYS